MSVIITVPHALCDTITYPGHLCDLIAGNVGKKLHDALPGPVLYHEADRPRYEVDLNRIPAMATSFMDAVITDMDSKVSDLFDIHSFPAGSENYSPHDLVVLVNTNKKNLENGPLSILLQQMGKQRGLDVQPLLGSTINNIVEQGLDRGIRSFLFEFNEDAKDDRINACIALIADWYMTYLYNRTYPVNVILSPVSGIVASSGNDDLTIIADDRLVKVEAKGLLWHTVISKMQVIKDTTLIATSIAGLI